MKRNQFLKSVLVGASALNIPAVLQGKEGEKMEQVGFEHLPTKQTKTMNTIIHRAATRGHANHGWLDSHHTFSFANYMNPERMHFGALRVLNDDIIDGGTGFGTHPHSNMEIVSIPLNGALEHKDSTGRERVIDTGDVQIMSAGRGISHSEYNYNKDRASNFLQIWVFPKQGDIEPRYDQKRFETKDRQNSWQTVVAPDKDSALWINQDAWFSLAELEKGKSLSYSKNLAASVLYLFVIEGSVSLNGETLAKRDGMGILSGDIADLKSSEDASLLLMELPNLK